MEALVGQRFGRYRVLEEIGRGAMGAVFKGYDATLDREVAIKVLAPHLVWDSQFVERFLREARVAARLHHPNIVAIYDVGQEGGWYYFVMEHLPGETLREQIRRRGALPPEEVVQIAAQLASALDYAHEQGVVHRDVKPGNVIVDPDGHVTLTDFGIVKAASETHLTATGMTVGTPEYMAPEQATGGEVGPWTDRYALGVVAYEMLSGRVPFQADSTMALLYRIVHEPHPPLHGVRPELPAAVDAVLGRALAKEPARRYPSAQAFVEALERALAGQEVEVVASAVEALPCGGAEWPETPTVVMEASAAAGAPAGAMRGVAAAQPSCEAGLLSAAERQGGTRDRVPREQGERRTTFRSWVWPVVTVLVAALAVGLTLTLSRNAAERRWQATQAKATFEAQARATETAIAQAKVPPACITAGQTWVREVDGMEMVCVPVGEFLMGSKYADPNTEDDEKPQHTVYLDAYWIDRTEVTVAQFRRFVQATGHKTSAEKDGWGYIASRSGWWYNARGANWKRPNGVETRALDDHPVVQVSWDDAQAYCEWVGGRLPTEAEWEKAARGTDGRIYPWGNEFEGWRLNCEESICRDGLHFTAPVGSFPGGASPYGALDMAGNVWEWVADRYDKEWYAHSPRENPSGPASGEGRVRRGGSWYHGRDGVRVANRRGDHPITRASDIGFRCVVAQGQ